MSTLPDQAEEGRSWVFTRSTRILVVEAVTASNLSTGSQRLASRIPTLREPGAHPRRWRKSRKLVEDLAAPLPDIAAPPSTPVDGRGRDTGRRVTAKSGRRCSHLADPPTTSPGPPPRRPPPPPPPAGSGHLAGGSTSPPDQRLEFEASIKGREEDYYSIPPWRKAVPAIEDQPPAFEWVPYFSDDEFGRVSELKCTSWRVEEFTLELARCMVGLQSFTEDKHLFSCSGTIVEFLRGVGYVVTSASLVKLPHEDEIADKLKINVCLPSGEILEGSVSNVDFCYNICVVEVRSTSQLPTKRFSADTRIFNFNDCHSKDVVALGRICKPWSLNVASGKLIPRRSQFDCEELLVSSCRISKIGVGGPLMDFDGNIIGMNFYDKKETPFLPGFIVLKCLQHFNDFKTVIRPLHGLRVKTLHEAQLTVLEKIHHVFPEVCGVIVEKVEVPSPEHSEIKVGDIITHVDGVPFSSAAELGGILLDTCGQHMLERQKLGLPEDYNQMATVISLKFDVKTLRGRKSETTTRTINVDKFTPSGKLNRWPLGRAYLLRRIDNGILYTEELYG